MQEIITIILSIATFLNSIMVIINFAGKIKKPVDNAIDKKFQDALEPLTEKLDKIDENQCRNFLVDFLSDVEKRNK